MGGRQRVTIYNIYNEQIQVCVPYAGVARGRRAEVDEKDPRQQNERRSGPEAASPHYPWVLRNAASWTVCKFLPGARNAALL